MVINTSSKEGILLETANEIPETLREEVIVSEPVSQDVCKKNDDKELVDHNKSFTNECSALVNLQPVIVIEDDFPEIENWDIDQMPIDIIETLPEIETNFKSAKKGLNNVLNIKVIIQFNFIYFFMLLPF